MNKEFYWNQALELAATAIDNGALIPLKTEIYKLKNVHSCNFEVRILCSKEPPHLIDCLPKPNPFRPWDKRLEIATINDTHILILNKYPVQVGHMLLITKEWAPQNGWIEIDDWKAMSLIDSDTTGLWFFNSDKKAGASQPHRHMQLLRRNREDLICPRELWIKDCINKIESESLEELSSSLFVSKRTSQSKGNDAQVLNDIYVDLCTRAGIGKPVLNRQPLMSYNLLITKSWVALIRRKEECVHGFSINALGFAGYLLATSKSDINWLEKYGYELLLKSVAN